jgi:hypothetical protein
LHFAFRHIGNIDGSTGAIKIAIAYKIEPQIEIKFIFLPPCTPREITDLG